MSDGGGPWDRAEAEARQRAAAARAAEPPRGRFLVWLAVMAAAGALLAVLSKAFPGSLRDDEDWMWLARSFGLFALVSAGILTVGKVDWAQKLRHVAIWILIVGVLVLGVTYRAELAGVVQKVRTEFSSSYPVATAPGELVINQDESGSFIVMGHVNGRPVSFLVDTGASDVVLSPEDAKRLGLDLATLKFDQPTDTANGIGYGAQAVIDTLAVGDIRFEAMPVMVNQTPMEHSLLGMTFLRRLESFHVQGTKLYLKAKP